MTEIQKTHFTCNSRLKTDGLATKCCECFPHDGCELNFEPIKELGRQDEADQLTTIEAIETHQFYGNHHYDAPAFAAIDTFIKREDTTMDEKVRALHHMGRFGMGVDDVTDEQDVQNYIIGALL